MRTWARSGVIAALVVLVDAFLPSTPQTLAASAGEIDRDVDVALQRLYDREPRAREFGAQANGVLVFPSVVKGGLMVGGQYGEGALRRDGKTVAYYNIVAASYGLQFGIQVFGYALFLMSDAALRYLERSEGWEIGTGPSIVVANMGAASAFTTTTAKPDIYSFFFNQQGLMAGLGLQGSKVTRIQR